jgi:hypothetical protein
MHNQDPTATASLRKIRLGGGSLARMWATWIAS